MALSHSARIVGRPARIVQRARARGLVSHSKYFSGGGSWYPVCVYVRRARTHVLDRALVYLLCVCTYRLFTRPQLTHSVQLQHYTSLPHRLSCEVPQLAHECTGTACVRPSIPEKFSSPHMGGV